MDTEYYILKKIHQDDDSEKKYVDETKHFEEIEESSFVVFFTD